MRTTCSASDLLGRFLQRQMPNDNDDIVPTLPSLVSSPASCPDNILKLGDFGIARVLNSDTELVRTVVS